MPPFKKTNSEPSDTPFAVANFSSLDDEVGLTPRETALVLCIGVSTYWAWLKQGKLDARRLGRTTRTTAGSIRRLIAEGSGDHAPAT